MEKSPEVDEINNLTYEEAFAELNGIIDRMEQATINLDDTLGLYERGTLLARRCSTILDKMEQKVTQLLVKDDDLVDEVPFHIEGEPMNDIMSDDTMLSE